MCGLPFSGKTSFAKKLEEKKGWERVDIDEIKSESGFEGVSDDDVSHEEWVKMFTNMFDRIRKSLNKGKTVISDISNLEKSDRDRLRKVAEEGNFPTVVVYLNTPVDIARKRWLTNKAKKLRFDLTEKIFEEACSSLQVPTEEENLIVLDYNEPVERWLARFD